MSQEPFDSGGDLPRLLRSALGIDAVLVLLTLLHFLVAGASFAHPLLYLAAIGGYATLTLAVRHAPLGAGWSRELLGAAGMVLFITGVLAFAGHSGHLGDGGGPLLNLYLLPIVTAALTQSLGATGLVALLVLAGRVTLSHFIEGETVATGAYALTLLAEAVPVLLVAFLTHTLAADIRAARERLQSASDRDELTGLLNLETFTRLLRQEREHAQRRGSGFGLVLVNIDGLKRVNERYGHEAGNRALVAVAQALRRSSRSGDLVARWGGDEFMLLLSGGGDAVAKALANTMANRIRHNVATTTLQIGGSLHRVTVSIGAATCPADGRDVRDLVKAVDRARRKDRDSRRPLERADAETRVSPSRALRG